MHRCAATPTADSSKTWSARSRIPSGAPNARHTADDVRDESGVGDLLVGHELDQEAIIRVQAGSLELGDRELGKTVLEKVEFDVLLIEDQSLKHSPAIERP